MTRLFLRFYFGVVLILVAAWMVQAVVFHQSSVEANLPVVEEIFSSSGRLARDVILENGPDAFPESMEYLDQQFDYPIQVVSRDELSLGGLELARLDRGESILFRGRLQTAIPETPYLVELGPLPRFAQPSQVELSVALGLVFLMTAAGIAFLLRPVIVQFRNIERTALAIAEGDLSARIDVGRLGHSAAMAGAFNTMADRVEAMLKSQRELFQTVSHELRTPLARIRFATELMESTVDQADRQQRIDAIHGATDRLDDLVGELLEYVRLDTVGADASIGREIERFDAGELVEELVEFHDPLYPEVHFVTEVDTADLAIDAVRNSLSRAVGNLISNAGKYAESEVVVSARRRGNEMAFVVDDDGPGVPTEFRESVFEPFKRLHDTSDDDSKSGAGLGLALVKRIAKACGGEVAIDDSYLGGSRFELTVPLRRSATEK